MSQSWILTLVAVVVGGCAILAAFGFRGRVTTVGIDLGTTFSVVGVSMHGKVVIVEDKVGHKIFPSVVSYQDNGDILTAYQAMPHMSLRPISTIFNAKRFIGRTLEEEDLQKYAKSHPFKVVALNSPTISNHSKVGFEVTVNGAPLVVPPEEIGGHVLRYLLSITADYLGHNQVNKAVIAVPAKFTPLQRQITGEAYKRAGLKVVRVLEEPTAAAVAYRLHKRRDIHHILVYDFGGGTLDVSLLFVSKGSVQVYATDGDDTLGGSDLDLCLFDMLKNKVEAEVGLELPTIGEYMGVQSLSHNTNLDRDSESVMRDLCISTSLRNAAENAKKQLSSEINVDIRCLFPIVSQAERSVELGPKSVAVTVSVSRDEFESGCDHLFERSMAPVTRLLEDLDMRCEEVDEVVLVGGSTRVPRIKRMLRDFFGKELNDHIDPDVTVAYGAASILD